MQPPVDFQSELTTSLKDSQAPCPIQVEQQGQDRQSRRFNVYRNNRAVSLIDSLKATYPAVCKLVGDAYFNAVARLYIDKHPPLSPVLAEYGSDFAAFIHRSPNAQDIPYIADVASLEWARLQSYHALDTAPLPVNTLASINPEDFDSLCFTVHPSLHLLSSPWPIGSLWSAVTQSFDAAASVNMSNAEHVVILRPELEVSLQVVPASGAALLERLRQADSLLQAVNHVSRQDPEFDPGSHLQGLLGLGAFSGIYQQDNCK